MSEPEIGFELEAVVKDVPASHAQMGRLNLLGLCPLAINFQLGVREKTPPVVITRKVADEILSAAKEQGLW